MTPFIAAGINTMTETMFSPDAGGRPEASKVVVILTAGSSRAHRSKILLAANRARREGINIFAIGVGDHVRFT